METANHSAPDEASNIPATMRAVGRDEYGEPGLLEFMTVPVPSPEPNQVLVRVHASSINPLDWHMATGTPMVMRLMVGLRRPKHAVRGADFAGVVEAVGTEVERFAVGDRVYGEGAAAWAEFMVINEKGIAGLPDGVTFEQAAPAPVAALTALQALRDWAGMKPGQSVLINGASGGVGTYAVQIAKALGASEVVGVCSTRNVEMVRSLGADRVIDYTKENFLDSAGVFDVFIDNVGLAGLGKNLRLVADEGSYVSVGGKKGRILGPIPQVIWAMIRNLFTKKKITNGLAKADADDLSQIAGWLDDGTVKSVIDGTYELTNTAEGLTYLGTGRTRGKNLVAIS